MATIYDVAKAAQVSPKTVSRVLNGDAPVGKATRRAVEEAIAALGYVPSSAARAMRSNKSGLIGLITGAISTGQQNIELSGLPDLIIVQGIQRALDESGKTLLIADTGGRSEKVAGLVRTFAEHRVEGVLYVAGHHQKVALPPVPGGIPLVLVNCFDEVGTPAVVPDDYKGQRSLVSGLIARGHRRIAYLSLSDRLVATQERGAGYRDALAEAGIAFDASLFIPADVATPDPEAEAQLLWDALDRVLALPGPPTAICFGNDRMAMRAYGMLRTRGVNLPRDISLAGFDNHKMIADTLFPRLTTVELPYAAMGVRATNLLLAAIARTAAPQDAPIRVSGPVIWRDSVGELPRPVTNLATVSGRTS